MFFESYFTSPLDRPVIVNKLEVSDIRYISKWKYKGTNINCKIKMD